MGVKYSSSLIILYIYIYIYLNCGMVLIEAHIALPVKNNECFITFSVSYLFFGSIMVDQPHVITTYLFDGYVG